MAKRKGSSRCRSMRTGNHVRGNKAVDEVSVLETISAVLPTQSKQVKPKRRLLPVELTKYMGIGSGRPVHKPLPEGYVGGWRRAGTGTIHVPTATLLVMQALQTWGASNARL